MRRSSARPGVASEVADLQPETWILAGAIGGVLGVIRATRPRVRINLDRGLLRSGFRTLRFDDIDRAWADHHEDGLSLRFGTTAMKLAVKLSGPDGRLIETKTQALLIQVVARSRIELPEDRFDPRGRYLRTTYPSNLTKDETLALLEG